MPLILVNPAVPVSTAEVFSALGARNGLRFVRPRAPFRDPHALVAFLHSTTNDLESPARKIAPSIGDALEELRDMPEILIARMSGSGATCFGIFETDESARSATALLKERHQEWWIVNTTIVPERIGVPTALQ
jgi:4-diphosphocytidyl-2-C-methyl-D-erythritol kinase